MATQVDPPMNDDGRRLVDLVRADVAAHVRSDDLALREAIERGVAATAAEVYPPDRPATGGVLDPDDAARVALAVWPAAEGFVADELAHPGHVPTPGSQGPAVGDLSTRQLLRQALGRRGRGRRR